MRRLLIPGVTLALLASGCQPPPVLRTFPEGSLPVHYVPATAPTTCLIAGVAMAANYLLGERRFTEAGIRQDLKIAGLDETSTSDLKTYLESKHLYLLTLCGELTDKPPAGLKYWLQSRGYPVVCVINRQGVEPAFNHAVVVTGISKTPDGSADIVYYLDPAGGRPMSSCPPEEFESLWARGQHAMMIVVAPPPDSQPSRPASTP